MRVAFITGSYPPDTCGVGDYTDRLACALRAAGTAVEIVTKANWRLLRAAGVIARINKIQPDVVHIQYPTVGFGWHLGPQLLGTLRRCVVTFHEVSQVHILRRVSLLPFTVRSRRIIFTNSFERDYAVRWFPWLSRRCSIIPVGSSISVGNAELGKDGGDIVYFGIIRPHKGLEDVFVLATLIHRMGLPYRIRIIGKPHPRHADYYQDLRAKSKTLPVAWNVDLLEREVADLLARSRIAYVPYPDGVSERRTSLLALLANGVATITTRGAHTPSRLSGAVEFVRSPAEALQLIQTMERDEGLRQQLADKGRAYANSFTWQDIALKHMALYEKVLSESR